jgi:hypothetical protein
MARLLLHQQTLSFKEKATVKKAEPIVVQVIASEAFVRK